MRPSAVKAKILKRMTTVGEITTALHAPLCDHLLHPTVNNQKAAKEAVVHTFNPSPWSSRPVGSTE